LISICGVFGTAVDVFENNVIIGAPFFDSGDLTDYIHYNAGGYIDLKPGFEVSGLGYFEGKIGPRPPPFTEDLTTPPYANRPFIFTEETLEKLHRSD
jgi:hypothetical protein